MTDDSKILPFAYKPKPEPRPTSDPPPRPGGLRIRVVVDRPGAHEPPKAGA